MAKKITILILATVGGALVLGLLSFLTDGRFIELLGGARLARVEKIEGALERSHKSIEAVDLRFENP